MDKEDPFLQLPDSDLAKRKTVFELRKLQYENSPIGRWLTNAPGLVTTLVSCISIVIATYTLSLQSQKARDDSDAAQAKQFADLIQAAADSKRGAGERIAAIWLLQRSWEEPKRTDVLANALCGIITEENDLSVIAACGEVLGHAYNKDTRSPIRQSLKKLLFGEVRMPPLGVYLTPQDVSFGAVLRAQNLVFAQGTTGQKTNEPVKERLESLRKAIEGGRDDLEGVNLYQAHLADIQLGKAFLANAYLPGADLTGANLNAADLRLALLENAHLEKASLNFANLQGADLTESDLNEATFDGANLEGARLPRSLAGVEFSNAYLNGVDLKDAHLEGARLERSHLEDVHLEGAHLAGDDKILDRPHLGGAYLQGAHLEGANLENAELDGAHLEGADLTKTNLKGATFFKANLTGTKLDGADLKGALLWMANLTGTKLDGADLDGAWVGDLNDLKAVLGTFKGEVQVVRKNSSNSDTGP